ncbi:MAG TPA: hypothetical protein VGN09_28290 [Vicinamibacteria bacterium]
MALLVAVGALGLAQYRVSDPHVRYDRFSLPAFDAYVHVAMAERPSVFTVAPWGYRVLAPALAAVLPGNAVQGFRRLAFLSLLAAAVLLHLFLRRVGLGELPALIGVAAFALSPPVAESLRYVFLDEPLSSALEAAFLLALASGAGAGVLTLVLTVWALAKELWVLFLPLVLLREWRRGPRPALATTLAVAAGPLAVTLILREWWWRPLGAEAGAGDAGWLEATGIALAAWRQWAGPILLLGLTPLALAGALRRRARPFAARYGWLAVVLLAVPLFAASYVSGSFFAADVTRLLLYALPLLLPPVLMAFFPVATAPEPPPAGRAPSRPSIAGAVAAAVIVLSLPLLLDRYRRIDLRGARDGPLILALCRESLQAARRLERDRPVVLDTATTGYEWGVSPPEEMGRMRWFLREGWGARAHYGTGDVVMQEPRASLVVPCLRPRELEAVLRLEATSPRPIEVVVNGRRLGQRTVGPAGDEAVVRLPADALFRGDNVLTLSAPDGPGLRFRSLALRPAP